MGLRRRGEVDFAVIFAVVAGVSGGGGSEIGAFRSRGLVVYGKIGLSVP